MQRVHLCLVLLIASYGFGRAAEIFKPEPSDCEFVVHDLSKLQSTTRNSLGNVVETLGNMQVSISNDSDPRLILTPKTTESFFFSFLRQHNQCFDGSNFDYISLEVSSASESSLLVGFSSNPAHCDEGVDSVIRYSMVLVANRGPTERSTIDIPISEFLGNATKDNMNAIVIGGMMKPIEIYSIKLKGSCSSAVTEATIVTSRMSDSGSFTPAQSQFPPGYDPANAVVSGETPSDDDSELENDSDCSLIIEDFSSDHINVNALNGNHGSDNLMAREMYTVEKGLELTSTNSSSYWYTVIPCTKLKHYDMVTMTVVGPKGGDFLIELRTLEGCEKFFATFRLMASSLLNGKLDGTEQQVQIPFEKLSGFNKQIHTIRDIVIGEFRNAGENHDNATPMNLNVKSVSLRGQNCDDDDSGQEPIQAQEKGSSGGAESNEGTIDSYSSSSPIAAITSLTVALLASVFLFTM